jgi:dTDP-4-amino-4,6-dideoxygalactose transaminase
MVTTNDAALGATLRTLRVHGSSSRYHYDLLGLNSRLDALQAAVLGVKLRYLRQWTTQRQLKADRYRELFDSKRLGDHIQLPSVAPYASHVYNQFVIRCGERDKLREFLLKRGIPTEIYYPLPLHLQPVFADLGYKQGAFPIAERASREVLALPIYPELREEHQQLVVDTIGDFIRGR